MTQYLRLLTECRKYQLEGEEAVSERLAGVLQGV